jgi:hypothetical protein
MRESITKISACTKLSSVEQIEIPKEKQDEIANRLLTREMIELMLDDIENLPINYKIEINSLTGDKVYKVEAMLIDKQELRRLQEIERNYNEFNTKLCDYFEVVTDKQTQENTEKAKIVNKLKHTSWNEYSLEQLFDIEMLLFKTK